MGLVESPSTPYDPKVRNEGATTFDYASESLAVFLSSQGLLERVRALSCGFYLQYNPLLTMEHLLAIRADLEDLLGPRSNSCEVPEYTFIGIWADAVLDPLIDCAAFIEKWLPLVDAFNTDMPRLFWG